MPTDTERRLEALENLALFGAGVTASTAAGRQVIAKTGVGAARAVAMSPVGRAVILGNLANQAAILAEEAFLEEQGIDPGIAFHPAIMPVQRESMLLLDPKVRKAVGRKVSKANKAVKHAMGLLKAGPKRSTGADKGKLVKGAFKIATKAAGLANPGTKSKIGKGKGKVKALARKIRSWW